MSPFLAEFIGTAVLLFLGIGVVANVSLNKTKAFRFFGLVVFIIACTFELTSFTPFFGNVNPGHAVSVFPP